MRLDARRKCEDVMRLDARTCRKCEDIMRLVGKART